MKNNDSGINATPKSYDKQYVVHALKFLFVIVNQYQGDYYIDKFKECGASCCFLTYGNGTATDDLKHILGIGEDKKDVVFCLVKADDINSYLNVCRERFKVSQAAKGVAFAVPVDSMIGVFAYQFITNTRQNRRK
ncbi:MAG: hypothetical protein WCS51_04280 [Bacilli bacterium]|jgi:hypothetical protein